MPDAAPTTADELLAPCPPRIRALAERLRAVVRRAVPTLEERVLPGWRALGYRDAQAGHVCALFPSEREVRLYLEIGARLDDPDGLLEGAATMRKGRFVRVAGARDVRVRAITRLVREATRRQSL